MANKIRLGFVGANVRSSWASVSHLPALVASPDVELTAAITADMVKWAKLIKDARITAN